MRRDESSLGESLAELAAHIVDAAVHLGELLDPDPEARAAAVRRIQEADHDAEASAHAVLRGLAASFITPFDRSDVFRLCWAMRRATARIDAVGDTAEVLRVHDLPPRAAELMQHIGRTAEIVAACVPRLGDPGPLSARWIELTVVVKQAGQTHRRLLLDVTTTVTDPATLVRQAELAAALRRVVEALEAVADAIQTVVVTES